MMKYKYGEFNENQISKMKESMRKQIFFLLLLADPATKDEYSNVNINDAIVSLLLKIDGFNSLLFYPVEIVKIQSLLEEALIQLDNPEFNFEVYRKLILDAGAEVLNIKEV